MKITYKLISRLPIIISSFFMSCTDDWTTFEEGNYQGKKFILQSRSQSGYFSDTNSIDYRFKLGDLPYVPINPLTTDWDVVYSTDIFGKDLFAYVATKDINYSNSVDSASIARSFLYLLPDNFSQEEYEKYVAFLKSDAWQKAANTHVDNANERCPFPYIVGVVYGNPEKYKKDFKGNYLTTDCVFRIENDGRIRLLDNHGSGGEFGTGLSPKVQMPDRIIYLPAASPGSLTIEDIKKFKNKQGQTPLDFFKFLPKS